MRENWRDQMRRYKDRWLIGISVVLSILIHIGLVVFLWYGASLPRETSPPSGTIDFDLTQLEPTKHMQPESEIEPDRLHFERMQGNQQRPDRADAYGFQDHDAGPSTHRADQPIEEIQRRPGPRGPRPGAGPGGSGETTARSAGGPRDLPPVPEVGEGVGAGSPSERTTREPDKSLDQMISRAGMASPSGGGGENGINPYNPNVGSPGDTLSISTKEYKYMSYFAHMKEKIELAWVYPQAAQQMGQQGTCTLKFTVHKTGKVSDIKVIKTSGYRLLDRYAVKAVNEAHFNPMPTNWPEKQLTIAANFIYRLIGVRTIQ